MLTVAEAITKAAARLSGHRIENARLDAEVLLAFVMGKDRAWLISHASDKLDNRYRLVYEQMLDRRAVREPLQYILGKQEFWGLEFIVTRDVLIPRPETELVVETALEVLAAGSDSLIIDLCTGSGCIAVSLAKELKTARIFATDKSPDALSVARQNAKKHSASNRIRFFEGDLFEPLSELNIKTQVDVITANPPYIKSGELSLLQPEVRDFEPEIALVAGTNGTEAAERIIDDAPEYLKSGGRLILEMGMGQAAALRYKIQGTGKYGHIEVRKDLAGIDRVIVASKK